MDKYFNNVSLKTILLFIGLGIWIGIFQNFGILPSKQNVIVRGGSVEIDGTVSVEGDVGVSGSVDVNSPIDVNLTGVLGYPVGCSTSYTIDGQAFQKIHVSLR